MQNSHGKFQQKCAYMPSKPWRPFSRYANYFIFSIYNLILHIFLCINKKFLIFNYKSVFSIKIISSCVNFETLLILLLNSISISISDLYSISILTELRDFWFFLQSLLFVKMHTERGINRRFGERFRRMGLLLGRATAHDSQNLRSLPRFPWSIGKHANVTCIVTVYMISV